MKNLTACELCQTPIETDKLQAHYQAHHVRGAIMLDLTPVREAVALVNATARNLDQALENVGVAQHRLDETMRRWETIAQQTQTPQEPANAPH